MNVAYAAQEKGKGRDVHAVQCYSCKEYGHTKTNQEGRTYHRGMSHSASESSAKAIYCRICCSHHANYCLHPSF